MSTDPVSDHAVADVRPGMRLGRYEILLGIAQGGMARVWAARQYGQRGFSKTVVIKTILPALASDREFENMFLDEARVAAGVHHPNVCEIFDLGEEEGVLYLAMEWVNGESLARLIKPPGLDGMPGDPRPIDARVAAKIVSDASAGLHAAHELMDDHGQLLNVVHRDVSPQNLLVSSDGTVKVTDFGVAKALGSLHEATMAGQVKGKAAYMSPEQASGKKVDRRSDIFALGICLYEATTGARPFSGPNQVAVLKQVLECRFHRPSAFVHNYPPQLEAIVLQAMHPDPAQRFQTAEQMRLALEQWLAVSGPVVPSSAIGELVGERVGHIVGERHARIRQLNQSATLMGMRAPTLSPSGFAQPAPYGATAGSFAQPSPQSSVTGGYVSPAADPNAVYAQQTSASSPSTVSHMRMVAAANATGQYEPLAPPPPPRANGSIVGALMGVAAGALLFLAVGGTYVVLSARTRGVQTAQTPLSQVPDAAIAPAAPRPTEAATKAAVHTAEVAEEPAKEEPKALSASIKLEASEPKSGVVFYVSGKQLVGGSISRPKAGDELFVIARADGYEEDKLRVDSSSPEVIDVFLKRAEKPAEPAALANKPAPTPTNTSGKSAPVSKTAPGTKPATSSKQVPKPATRPTPRPTAPAVPDSPF